ncbi:glycosyltransferase family 2 protein [Candidatus Uhrbacteria bacterium]|nr:glycosyltransferase family 2 protein [Candidatus Uhrbacteria bacterium]
MNEISVIIPTFQHTKTIENCIDSLLSQTLLPKEIIVVDDGSTDDTKIRIDRFGDKIKYVFQNNQGAPTARNNGAKLATGNFLLFSDADIFFKPNMLEKMFSVLETHKDVSYVYCGFLWDNKKFPAQTFDADKLRKSNYIHTTSLIRKQDFPGFDPKIKRLQDWDLWLTMLENNKIGMEINEILFYVRNVSGRKNISKWTPSILYRIPWYAIGWTPKTIRDFKNAEKVIKIKHRLKFKNFT